MSRFSSSALVPACHFFTGRLVRIRETAFSRTLFPPPSIRVPHRLAAGGLSPSCTNHPGPLLALQPDRTGKGSSPAMDRADRYRRSIATRRGNRPRLLTIAGRWISQSSPQRITRRSNDRVGKRSIRRKNWDAAKQLRKSCLGIPWYPDNL